MAVNKETTVGFIKRRMQELEKQASEALREGKTISAASLSGRLRGYKRALERLRRGDYPR